MKEHVLQTKKWKTYFNPPPPQKKSDEEYDITRNFVVYKHHLLLLG
jgi:hypothetical protein